jgi:hypothetical membrane protein
MDIFIELLQNKNWMAWTALVIVVLLALLFLVKFTIKIGKLFFILLILGGIAFGLTKIFPQQSAPIIEAIRSFMDSKTEDLNIEEQI